MSTVGQLTISARWADGLSDFSVTLVRPPVARLFLGQSPAAVIKMVPYLYALCGEAQRAVAGLAFATALGEPARPNDETALWVEMLHENLWRLLLDWPVAVGLPPARAPFIAWRERRREPSIGETTQDLLRDAVRPLAQKCLEILVDRSGDLAVAHDLAPQAWFDWWTGQRGEPPPVALPLSVAAAFRGRVAEIERGAAALLAGRPFPLASVGGNGWAVAQALTARGVLTHAVHLADGVVARYSVQAPTDACFADAAPLVRLLAEQVVTTPEEARQAVELAVLALDPCLPYDVVLTHA